MVNGLKTQEVVHGAFKAVAVSVTAVMVSVPPGVRVRVGVLPCG